MAAFALLAAAQPSSAQADRISASPPERPDTAATYVFYLHGQIIETAGRRPTHPRFGIYEYDEILAALAGPDRFVISEQRPPDADVAQHAATVADQIRRLLDAGVAADQIAVVGFSKGGRIAIAVSSRLREPIAYVFLAACNRGVFDDLSNRVSGRILSVYEESDEIGVSCAPLFERSPSVLETSEIRISTGARHGAFYVPRREWLGEVLRWVGGTDRQGWGAQLVQSETEEHLAPSGVVQQFVYARFVRVDGWRRERDRPAGGVE